MHDPSVVLLLPQARFKYPPHWVSLSTLYEAMAAVDPATAQPRGFLRLAVHPRPDSVLFTLDIRSDESWRDAEHFIRHTAPALVQVGWAGVLSWGCCCCHGGAAAARYTLVHTY